MKIFFFLNKSQPVLRCWRSNDLQETSLMHKSWQEQFLSLSLQPRYPDTCRNQCEHSPQSLLTPYAHPCILIYSIQPTPLGRSPCNAALLRSHPASTPDSDYHHSKVTLAMGSREDNYTQQCDRHLICWVTPTKIASQTKHRESPHANGLKVGIWTDY